MSSICIEDRCLFNILTRRHFVKQITLTSALFIILLLLTGCNNDVDTPKITETIESSDNVVETASSLETTNVPETTLPTQLPDAEVTSDTGSTNTEPQTDDTSTNIGTNEPIEATEPEQTHVGVWYIDAEKKHYIRITQMDFDKVVFSAKPHPDVVRFTFFAVKQGDEYVFGKDISPRNAEELAKYNLSGKLILEDDGIKLIYNPSDLYDTEIVQHFTIKNETDKLEWPNADLPTGIAETLQGIIDKFDNAGWTDFEVLTHEPDSKTRWGGLILEPYDLPENAVLYCVTARSRRSYVNVYAVFKDNEQIDEVIYYVGMNGRVMDGVHLESFMERYNCDIIIPADFESLHYYFECY